MDLSSREKISIVLLEGDSELNTLQKVMDSGNLQQMSVVKTNTVDSLYNEVSEHKPDIVILNMMSIKTGWVVLISRIKQINPEIKIIAWSLHIAYKFILEILEAGAKGYVVNGNDLLPAINMVRKGDLFLGREILVSSEEDQKIPAVIDADVSVLAEREQDVVRLMGMGMNTKEIAHELKISVGTVPTYRKRLMEKLNIYSILGLTKFAIKAGLQTEKIKIKNQ
ncbi:MAG: response regulator transcription factor [Spirochaetales bacterium]|nr:response regulator transcription factor [Spirochaetales bacterium]